MTTLRVLLLSGLLSAGVLTAGVFAPSTAHALEQDGISMATYQSIMKCDVDIRADLSQGSHSTLASLKAAIRAIDADLAGAEGATHAKLSSWRDVLSAGAEALEAGGKEKKTLDELQKKMGAVKMVVEAQNELESQATEGR